jgi:hypothetical protein
MSTVRPKVLHNDLSLALRFIILSLLPSIQSTSTLTLKARYELPECYREWSL